MSEPTLYLSLRDADAYEVRCMLDLLADGGPGQPPFLVSVEPERERIANRIAIEYLTDTGPCAFCDSEVGARHRVADAIVDEVLAALGIGGDEDG